ncbi:putative decaprenylphosphoryl-beta-D-ribose oxidase [Legionella massiliensis]|uniref:Putative decaprenylphosphoryl-beta-D-ribose oxidase n=1 Tax=Legionella massiliensis TaxID=1034943 RepID=A0A078KRF9_9GAMM|nr:FAD-binding protein [Legionella massiliensis]CDZ77000.1 putative decaprenylphosphoryl-beta-D-ribose oxidase [Legionella massiliensis]CEE12738.1 putative decaprenylphosphoryl-beta-D-ribose oxidase [Legionella massiliensis]
MTFKEMILATLNRLRKVGCYAEIPAGWIDHIELIDKKSFIQKAFYFVLERLIFISLFPVLTLVDAASSLLFALGNFVAVLFSSDDRQDYFISQAKEYATLFSKNLLGFFFSPLGLIYPKYVSFFFTPEREIEGAESGGSLYHADVEKAQPQTVEELQDIIRQANINGQSVMAVGAGRSQGMQFIPQGKQGQRGILIDMSQFNTISIDGENKTAIVGAGVRWVDLQLAANAQHLALKVMQASNVFSVGGSIGTNIHGWDHRSGNLAQVIRTLRIINSQGEIEDIDQSSPKFGQILGGFGMFGIVISAEIELTNNERLVEHGVDIPIEDYVDYFREHVQTNDSIHMHLYRLSLDPNNLLGNGVAVNYTKIDNSAPLRSEKIFREGERGTRRDRMMVNVARNVGWVRKRYWDGERARLLQNETPMTTNEIMQPPINAMFNSSVSETEWLQEYFVPGENLAEFNRELGALLMENQVALINGSVRFIKQDQLSTMGYAVDGDRFAIVLCFNQSLKPDEIIKTKKWVRQANDLVIKHGGSFYLPYQQFATQEQFEAAYGADRIEAVRQAKQAADPNNVFYSGLAQQYFERKEEKPNLFRALMASEETKKKFAGFLENVLQRVDTDSFYTLLEDIMKYNDSHEEIYAELLRRLPEIMPGQIGSLRRILGSLSAIKDELGAQARTLLPGVERINGLVEIGYPGRFVAGFKSDFNVEGTITAVYEEQSLTDYIQAGFPRPYDQFVKLDYNLPDLSSIPDSSADLITCYVGLHHFPEEQLGQFLQNLRRILRPEGRFLLVDHDVRDEESLLMANMAHTIFNAVNGVPLEEEMNEIRNFQPMSYWNELLEEHGLGQANTGPELAMIRQGDPSRNTMAAFAKPPVPNPYLLLGTERELDPDDDEVVAPYQLPGLTLLSSRPRKPGGSVVVDQPSLSLR